VKFWSSKLKGVLDKDDVAEVANKLSAAGFKQRHVGKLTQEALSKAGLNQGAIMDLMDNQHLLIGRCVCGPNDNNNSPLFPLRLHAPGPQTSSSIFF